jgi:hypothetical protein
MRGVGSRWIDPALISVEDTGLFELFLSAVL